MIAALARLATWSFIGTVLSRVAALGLMMILARVMSVHEFARYSLVYAAVSTYAGIIGLSVGVPATRHISAARAASPGLVPAIARRVTGQALATLAALLAGMLLARQPLEHAAFGGPIPTDVWIAAVFGFAIAFGLNVAQALLWGFEAHRSVAFLNGLHGLVIIPFNVLLLRFHSHGAYWALPVCGSVPLIIGVIAVLRFIRSSPPGGASADRVLGHTGYLATILPSVLGAIVTSGAAWFATAQLMTLADGARETAFFSVATHWRTLASFLPNIVAVAALPVVTRALASNPGAPLRSLVAANIGLNATIVALFGAVVWVGWPVIARGYGPEYLAAFSPVMWLLVATLFQSIAGVLGQFLAARNRLWRSFGANLAWSAALVLAGWHPWYRSARELSMAYSVIYVGHLAIVALLTIKTGDEARPAVSATEAT